MDNWENREKEPYEKPRMVTERLVMTAYAEGGSNPPSPPGAQGAAAVQQLMPFFGLCCG